MKARNYPLDVLGACWYFGTRAVLFCVAVVLLPFAMAYDRVTRR